MNQEENKNQICISVVIPTYNSGPFIARAIDSVLNQTLAPCEIIVVDDGSTDNTAQVVKKYDNVKYIHQQNAGASVARNTGIEAATGNWIAFLDADDEWMANNLELQTELLKRNPQLVWTFANYMSCLCDENRKGPRMEPSKAKNLLGDKDFFDNYLEAFNQKCHGCTITMLVKKDVLIECGMFLVGQKVANDQDMWFRIAYKHPQIGYTPEPLAVYHLSVPESITKKYAQIDFLIEFVKRHLELGTKHGYRELMESWARSLITLRIRSLFFVNEPEKIKRLTDEFGEILDLRFMSLIKILMICPKLTASLCHLISKIVRTFNLRKHIIQPPKKPKQ